MFGTLRGIKSLFALALLVTMVLSFGLPKTAYAAEDQITKDTPQQLCVIPAPYVGTADAAKHEICINKQLNYRDTLYNVLNFLVGLVGVLAVLFLVIGGARYITAGDSKDSIEQARRIIRSAIVGVLIVIASIIILNTLRAAIVCGRGQHIAPGTGNVCVPD